MGQQAEVGAFLVGGHQPRVTGDIGSKDCRQPTFDTLPFGFDACKPALELMSSYALEMKIIPRRYSVEELFDDTTRGL